MVDFLRKKKGETFADGRVIVMDFKKVRKEDFPQYEYGDMFFLNYDGKIYIDANEEANKPIIAALKTLVRYPKAELLKWERERKRLYPDIKDIGDLGKLKGNSADCMKALSMFLVPLEIKSREMRRAYYG